jgi:hypothetical protein
MKIKLDTRICDAYLRIVESDAILKLAVDSVEKTESEYQNRFLHHFKPLMFDMSYLKKDVEPFNTDLIEAELSVIFSFGARVRELFCRLETAMDEFSVMPGSDDSYREELTQFSCALHSLLGESLSRFDDIIANAEPAPKAA